MTRDELIATFIKKRTKVTALTWAQFVSAVGASSADQKAQILLAVNGNDKDALASIIFGIAHAQKASLASDYVNGLVADNNLTIDELLTLVD